MWLLEDSNEEDDAECLTGVTRASSSCNTGFIGAITGNTG